MTQAVEVVEPVKDSYDLAIVNSQRFYQEGQPCPHCLTKQQLRRLQVSPRLKPGQVADLMVCNFCNEAAAIVFYPRLEITSPIFGTIQMKDFSLKQKRGEQDVQNPS